MLLAARMVPLVRRAVRKKIEVRGGNGELLKTGGECTRLLKSVRRMRLTSLCQQGWHVENELISLQEK